MMIIAMFNYFLVNVKYLLALNKKEIIFKKANAFEKHILRLFKIFGQAIITLATLPLKDFGLESLAQNLCLTYNDIVMALPHANNKSMALTSLILQFVSLWHY